MKSNNKILACLLTVLLCSFISFENGNYNIGKKYSVKALKEDFLAFRDTLEKFHPRLYEFTDKVHMDKLFDSLYSGINKEMNEIEFRYYLLPIIAKIHCSHTGVGGSRNYVNSFKSYYKFPPFKLYYEKDKAFVLYNFSNNPELAEGTEVLLINNTPAKTIISNFLLRTTLEGIHENAQYWKMNETQTSLFNGYPDYYKQSYYDLETKSKSGKVSKVRVNSITPDSYLSLLNERKPENKHAINFIDSINTAILTFPVFQFPIDTMYQTYIPTVFKLIKDKSVHNLIIDMRGNGGGPGFVAGSLLMHLLKDRFIYYDSTTTTGPGFEEFKRYVNIAPNAFTGNLYCLMDEGCLSSSGHFLSMIKYHKRGVLIGGLCTAGYSCNGSGVPHELPHTKLVLACPFAIYETKTQGFKRSEGIIPDHEISPTLNDMINKKDPVLSFALGQIKKNK